MSGPDNSLDLEALHRLHSYCAGFPSELAENAINTYSKPGESVYDPFCGSGTSLVAGLALGRHVVGSDIDVLAGMLSSVKCTPASKPVYEAWRKRFDHRLISTFAAVTEGWHTGLVPKPGDLLQVGGFSLEIPGFPELNYWFPPQVIALLAAIAREAHACKDPHLQQVALGSLGP